MFVLRCVFRYCRPHGALFALSLFCLLVDGLYGALAPLSLKYLIDDAFLPGNFRVFGLVLTLLAVGGALAFAASLFGERMLALVTERVLYRLRQRMLDRVMRRSPAIHDRYDQGTLLSRLTNDVGVVDRIVSGFVPDAFRALLSLGLGAALLFRLEWKLALLMSAGYMLLFFAPNVLRPRATSSAAHYREAEDDYVGGVREVLAGYRVIKGMNLRDAIMARMDNKLRALFAAGYRLLYVYALLDRVPFLAFMLLNAGVIACGGLLIFRGDLGVGAFMAFYAIFLTVGQSVTALSQLLPSLMQAEVSFRRIEEILTFGDGERSAGRRVPIEAVNGEIRFDQVRFRYGDNPPVLDDVSFTIPAGSLTAFVGPSGSGKSTALQLLMRLYEPESGSIQVDGTDIRDLDETHFSKMTGIVFQDSFLFRATVEENIRIAAPDVSDGQVRRAAAEAQIHDQILAMPDGYQTVIGDSGETLSGGQRQRIGIARALVKNPGLLLLDEITSALDPATEAEIHELIERMRGERTIVMVTHRLASVVQADNIVVFQNGKAVETGTHDQLMRRGGVYRQMWDKQHGFRLSADGLTAGVTGERLAMIPFFRGIPAEQLERIAEWFVPEHHHPGHVLFRENDPGDKFYVIVRGAVAVHKRGVRVSVLEEGDHFGEIALLNDVPRTADIIIHRPTTLLSLQGSWLRRLMDDFPTIRQALEQSLKERSAS